MSARDAVKTNEAAPSGDAGSAARERAAEPRNARGQRRARSEAPSFGAFVRKPGRDSASGGALDGRLDGRPDGEPQTAAAEAGPRAAAQSSWPADAVEVGAVVDAYGLKGWVKVAPHAQDGGALLSAKRWWLLKGSERRLVARLSAKVHGDSVVGQLAGVADRDAALLLRGTRIYVSRAEFPAPAADEYYWVDLIGLDVANEAGVGLGKVADLIDNGAHSVLRVEYPSTGKDGKPSTGERLIPFVGVYVKTVDLAAKRIVVEWEADY